MTLLINCTILLDRKMAFVLTSDKADLLDEHLCKNTPLYSEVFYILLLHTNDYCHFLLPPVKSLKRF